MTHDFLIIGGGIAGLSAGAHLAELGNVLLLEAEPALAYHASGRSAALYEAQYGKPTTIALNLASRTDHETIDGGVLSPRGLMLLAGPDEEEVFAHDAGQMGLDIITPEEAAARVPALNPQAITGAAVHDDAWDIDTDRLIQHFARAIRSYGGRVQTSAAVTAIARTAHGWQVTAAGETHEARILVNAAGAWADAIAAMAGVAPIGLTPLRRSVARIPAPGGHDVSRWPMLLGAGERWYAKPDAGQIIVSPAEEDPVDAPHDAWPEDLRLAEGIARYQHFVTDEVTRLTASWAGLRTFAPDRTLVLGPDPDTPGFVWVAGQGGYGFQTAPAAARLVADLVAGRAPVLDPRTVAALSPARFR
ncbi:NAD(P)/FAD-dependent oxidoreductase [Roseicyclus marinus]|uniref:NAD(P)/FAD-dependent oxidoreductase n=1 Tax=Roseicyclus marinus TaxID=2161673 RepID=UPI00240FF111|nr:FAD-binding oxidoreductase [Roseicyclus marinus]MDG3041992.1 FAD-binding oxidoreductase [Roseicyclus marinus]